MAATLAVTPASTDKPTPLAFLPNPFYQVYAGGQQDLAVAFLKAYGCAAVIGGGSDSREVYHPYAHPEKFQGLPELWHLGLGGTRGTDAGMRSLRSFPKLARLSLAGTEVGDAGVRQLGDVNGGNPEIVRLRTVFVGIVECPGWSRPSRSYARGSPR